MIELKLYDEKFEAEIIDYIIDFFGFHALLMKKEDTTSFEEAKDILKNWISEDHELYLIYKDNIVCGLIHLWLKGKTVFWLEDIYVAKEFRNQGIASQAILMIEDVVKANRECMALCIDVVPRNQSAMALYNKLGYDAISVITLRKAVDNDSNRDKEIELFDLTFKY